MIGVGRIQDLTTQRHDFSCKPIIKRMPFRPKDWLSLPKMKQEYETVQKLSYQDYRCSIMPTLSCKPMLTYKRPEGNVNNNLKNIFLILIFLEPMEFETTQKLSFMPVCPAPKECYPWAQKSKYQPPTQRMDSDTVQKLSFAPPGQFVDAGCCCEPALNCCQDNYPRAGIIA